MTFEPPTFNLTAAIYTGPYVGRVFRENSPCNLAVGRRVLSAPGFYFGVIGAPGLLHQIMFPAFTDVRDGSQVSASTPDIYEIPPLSGEWYISLGWGDVGKGFVNEYRLVYATKTPGPDSGGIWAGSEWPIPAP